MTVILYISVAVPLGVYLAIVLGPIVADAIWEMFSGAPK